MLPWSVANGAHSAFSLFLALATSARRGGSGGGELNKARSIRALSGEGQNGERAKHSTIAFNKIWMGARRKVGVKMRGNGMGEEGGVFKRGFVLWTQ